MSYTIWVISSHRFSIIPGKIFMSLSFEIANLLNTSKTFLNIELWAFFIVGFCCWVGVFFAPCLTSYPLYPLPPSYTVGLSASF